LFGNALIQYVQAPFWSSVVAESTVIYQHRFYNVFMYLYLEADGPALMVPGKREEEKSWNLSKWVPGTKSEESYNVEFDS
jgi:hypothetical protein